MDVAELFRSAVVAIRTNKTRSVLTTLGIVIGVASVILLVSIGNGLQNFVSKEFEALGSNSLFVAPGKVSFGGGPPQNVEAKFDFDDVRRIEDLGDPIVSARGMVSKPSTFKYRSETFFGSIVGVSEDYLDYGNVKMEYGEFFDKSALERSSMVGVIGNKAYIELFGEGERGIGKEISVAGKTVKIIGKLQEKGGGFGGAGDENTYLLMPVTSAMKVTGIDKPAAVMVKTADAEGVSLAAKKIKNYFEKKKLTDDDYTIMEPKELLASINSFLGVVTGALSGIAAISLVVGGIGIANIMLVSVTERTREIGLRKALGATSGDILRQFLIEAVVLSILGGGLGILIGGGLSMLLRQFIETSVTSGSVIMAFGISAIVGIVAGLAPAIRASRLNPIEALRWE